MFKVFVFDFETRIKTILPLISRLTNEALLVAPFHSNEGWGLFSPVDQDRQWVHRPSAEKVLVKLGTKHLALC